MGPSDPSSSPPGESSGGPSGDEEASRPMPADAVECPNCDRQFVGTYCPECGTAVDQTLRPVDIVSGFFREFADIEQGILPTLWALTRRPGSALRAYLRGDKRRLMNPGRYLLAAVVVGFAANQVLLWIGARKPYTEQRFAQTDGSPAAPLIREMMTASLRFLESQMGLIVVNVLTAGLLALLLWRLFRSSFDRGAEALALGCFLAGHAGFLEVAAKLVYAPLTVALTGRPAELSFVYTGISVVYVGIATYGLERGWKSAAKGLFGIGWASVEMASLSGIGTAGYGLWLMHTRPDAYLGAKVDAAAMTAVLAGMAVAFAVPLLLHAAVEAYYRLR